MQETTVKLLVGKLERSETDFPIELTDILLSWLERLVRFVVIIFSCYIR